MGSREVGGGEVGWFCLSSPNMASVFMLVSLDKVKQGRRIL